MELAPIIIFCYNRPWHVEQTLEALSKNVYAEESVLYIYCDGAKTNATEEQLQKIKETRAVVRKKQWCKKVFIIEADKNKGLANSIIGGVTDVINKYGKVIVLEDDLLTSPYFLKYLNEALDKYENRPGVMSISANRPPMSKMQIPEDYPYDVFVSLRAISTGWATWKDRWSQVNWTMDYLPNLLMHKEEMTALCRAGDDMLSMLLLQRDGKIDSWAVQFGFAHFYNHAIAILPCIPYVDNIGFDGTGTHSGMDETDYRNDVNKALKNPKYIEILYEDKRIINAFWKLCSTNKKSYFQKLINKVFNILHVDIKCSYNKKIYC